MDYLYEINKKCATCCLVLQLCLESGIFLNLWKLKRRTEQYMTIVYRKAGVTIAFCCHHLQGAWLKMELCLIFVICKQVEAWTVVCPSMPFCFRSWLCFFFLWKWQTRGCMSNCPWLYVHFCKPCSTVLMYLVTLSYF